MKKAGNVKFLLCWRTWDDFRPKTHISNWHKQNLDSVTPCWIIHPSTQPLLH